MNERLMALATKELLESRWRLLAATALMVATAVSLPLLFDWLKEIMTDLPLPARWTGAVEAQLANYRLYLWSNWWGKNHYQLMTIAALIWGMGIIARERASGTLSYLLSRPISRSGLLATKWLVGAGSLAAISLASTLALVVTAALVGDEVPWYLLSGYPQATMGVLVVFSFTTLCSALVRDQVMALVVAGCALAAVSVVGWSPVLRPYSLFYQMAAPGTWLSGRLDPVALAAMAVATCALLVLSGQLVRRMDL